MARNGEAVYNARKPGQGWCGLTKGRFDVDWRPVQSAVRNLHVWHCGVHTYPREWYILTGADILGGAVILRSFL